MLGRAKIDEDITLPVSTAFAVPAESVGPERLGVKFTVEEEGGMFVEAEAFATLAHTVGGESIEFTLLLNGVDTALGAEGWGTNWYATVNPDTLHFRHLLQLDKGEYTLELALKAATGQVSLPGATWPSWLTVKRTSHDAVLAQGVNAKSDDIY